MPAYAQQTSTVTAPTDSSFNKFFYEAEIQKYKGNYDSAYELYNYCLQINPESGASLYNLATLNRYMRRDSVAICNMEKAVQLYPENYWYKDMLVKLYFNNRRTSDAQHVLEEMAIQFPDKTDVLMMLADLYTSNNDYENVISILDKIETREGKSEQLSLEKFRIYIQAKKDKEAFAEMQDLANEYPNDLRYQVLIGECYADAGKEDEALRIYKEVEQKDSSNVNVQLALANLYQKKGNDELYQQQLERLVTNPNLDRSTRVQILVSVMYDDIQNPSDSTKILRLFNNILSQPQEDTQILELFARYMVTRNMSDDSLKPVLYSILELDPENDLARNQLLTYAIDADDTDNIIALCKTAVDYKSENAVYYYFLGLGYYRKNEYKQACTAFRNGIDYASDESKKYLSVNMFSLLGDMYHKLGDDKNCFLAYDSCLIYTPDDASVLNNYAYYLSLKNLDLDRAQEMSKKSNSIDTDNYTYIDTYAWILFQQKKYNEALTHIDRALELIGDEVDADDTTIIEHAGDIYFKCGNKERALELWQQAYELGGSDNIPNLEQKIKKKKL